MGEEKRNYGAEDPIKLFLEESVSLQRNEVMDNFAQILQRLPIGDASSLSGGTIPFKVHINFSILILEGKIYVDTIDKWLNLLEGYFSVHNVSNRENTTFSLLKVVPHVKYWWDTFCEQKEIEGYTLFVVTPT
jgi:hypothetical protein